MKPIKIYPSFKSASVYKMGSKTSRRLWIIGLIVVALVLGGLAFFAASRVVEGKSIRKAKKGIPKSDNKNEIYNDTLIKFYSGQEVQHDLFPAKWNNIHKITPETWKKTIDMKCKDCTEDEKKDFMNQIYINTYPAFETKMANKFTNYGSSSRTNYTKQEIEDIQRLGAKKLIIELGNTIPEYRSDKFNTEFRKPYTQVK